MFQIYVLPSLLVIIFVVRSNAFLSDIVKEVNFTKLKDNSNEFEFEYKLDNGTSFHGRTWALLEFHYEPYDIAYIMFGENKSIYWVNMHQNELTLNSSFFKSVRPGKLSGDELILRDDIAQYTVTICRGILFFTPYQTEWDFNEIYFSKAENGSHTFDYIISSKNNSRKYNGTTYYETDDPLVQRIHVLDWPQRDSVHEVSFTMNELHSNETFYKGIVKDISMCGISAAFTANVNTKLLKCLSEGC